MLEDVEIEPVPDEAFRATLEFLVGGSRRGVPAALRAEAYERMIAQCGGRFRFWRARRGERCLAASLVIASAGRVGMVFHCPLKAPGVEARHVSAVVREASRQALGDGLAFVQSLIAPARRAEREMIASAGFQRLAELAYMRLDLSRALAEDDPAACAWRDVRGFGEQGLAGVIQGTYEGSLDCPALWGLRELPDVIEGHKACGVYQPQSWWIAVVDGRPAGCILVNGSGASTAEMEIVYMGVVRGFRGRRIGRAMVRRAARRAREEGCAFLNVVVDDRNVYARNVYDQEGFRELDRRVAWILTGRRGGEAQSARPSG
jgi:ribosomal protein S18 acetylase RimI-like enzyme